MKKSGSTLTSHGSRSNALALLENHSTSGDLRPAVPSPHAIKMKGPKQPLNKLWKTKGKKQRDVKNEGCSS
jgi:hypothetical protein